MHTPVVEVGLERCYAEPPALLPSITHALNVALDCESTNTPPPLPFGSSTELPEITQFANVALAGALPSGVIS